MTEDDAGHAKTSGLYHFIWRWHFYAGLFVAPFLVILAVTGAIYLFNDPVEGFFYRKLMTVTPSASAVAASVEEAAARGEYPGSTVTRYEAPIGPDRASEWSVRTRDGEVFDVFINPADGAVVGSMRHSQRLGAVLVGLHGDLLMGEAGDYLVEFAGCWAFVLLTTGLFLWWPRKGRRVGVAAPRLKAKGRAFWRDIHAVPAMWNAPLVAFLIITGLPWSSFWGQNLARIGTIETLSPAMEPSPNFKAPPGAPLHAEHQRHALSESAKLEDRPDASPLPWSVRQAPLPRSSEADGRISIDFVIEEAWARSIGEAGLRILYPQSREDVFTLSYVPDKAEGQRTVHMDPANGDVLEDIGWRNYSPLGKAVEFGVETHVGRQFGLANQLLMAASCLLVISTVVFGIVTWWRRRPKGRLGAPPAPAGFSPGPAVILASLALGVVFPMVGASIIVILMIEAAGRMLKAAS